MRSGTPVLLTVAFLAAADALAAPAAAQEPTACAEGRIGEVVISNQSVFDLSDPGLAGGRFAWAYRVANSLHIQTDTAVIRRELLFRSGDCYDVDVLRDSERLLRRFRFLADAEVFGIREDGDQVQVVVDTQDEWSTQVQPKFETDNGVRFTGIRLVENNVLGTGQSAQLFYDNDDGQVVSGVAYFTPQLLRTRADGAIQVGRTDVGTSYRHAIAYPFVGESGRYGFRQVVDHQDRYFELFRRDAAGLTRIWQPVRRQQIEFSAATRQGEERYNHNVYGIALTGERVQYDGPTVFADSAGHPEVPGTGYALPWQDRTTVRALGLFGRRQVNFVRRHGYDTLNSTEDFQLGYEGEVSFGPSIPWLQDDPDVAVATGFSWAADAGERMIVGLQSSFETTRQLGGAGNGPGWRNVLGEADAWGYFRPSPDSHHTLVASVGVAGGWNATMPFQLTIGSDTGLRGFPRHLEAGGRRMVASVEHRAFLGWPLPDLADLGTVIFADAGKIWPGDAPFGIESPLLLTAGFGVRAAFPAGSRQTFRADIGFPLRDAEDVGRIVVSVGVGQLIGRRGAGRDPQLARSANYRLTSAAFAPY